MNSFLPPPKRNDVSVLRHDYTNTDFCKQHVSKIQIGGSEYHGLAVILAKSIQQVNDEEVYTLDNGQVLSVKLQSTPLDGLPMHADILYSHSLQDDEPKILMRKIAKKIIKYSIFCEDKSPTGNSWDGEKIHGELFN